MIRLLGARVLVKEDKLDEKTAAGIIIPGREQEATCRGTVIKTGPGAYFEDGTLMEMSIKEGERVVYTHFAGSPIEVDGDIFIIMNERDVMCVLD